MHLVQPTLPPVGVLIVDDQKRNLEALDALLTSADYSVVRADSGQQALDLLEERDFAVVLLDVMMPRMDGFETAERIRRSVRCKKTPIIFVTAVADDMGFIFRGYSAGAVDYITKPLQPAVVRAKVAVFAELFRAKLILKAQLESMRQVCVTLEDEVAQGRREREDAAAIVRRLLERLEQSVPPSLKDVSLPNHEKSWHEA